MKRREVLDLKQAPSIIENACTRRMKVLDLDIAYHVNI
jgi:hypothetical protein